MSDTALFQRRDFLKLVGLGVAGAAASCAPPADKLMPFLVQPNDVLPGVPYWFASTCNECPAGCGVRIKQREGRAIKVEGNPLHPVNRGALCARGQAALQGLYDPDRLAKPRVREGGSWKDITWDDAFKLAGEKFAAARGKVAVLTGHQSGSLQALADDWAKSAGGTHLQYEAFAHESLREANRRTFGIAAVPNCDFAAAKMVISFGADFLDTWLAPVANARGFAAFRAQTENGAGTFVTVEPRLSTTGASADEWVSIKPGTEMVLVLGMVNAIVGDNLARAGADAARDASAAYTPEEVERLTEVKADTVRRLARRFIEQQPSLAVAGGIAAQSEQSVALLTAVNLLNHVAGNVGQTVRFDRTLELGGVGGFNQLQNLIAAMDTGEVQAVLVHGANPAHTAPAWAGFGAAFTKVPFKVALVTSPDETTEMCDLVLPVSHSMESWGDAESVTGVFSIQQPGMRPVPMFDSRASGEILIGIGKAGGFGSYPDTWLDYVKGRWQAMHGRFGAGRSFDDFWTDTLEQGGAWNDTPGTAAGAVGWSGTPTFALPELKGAGDLALLIVPTGQMHDGRGANKPWLQELPDPTSKIVWNTWAEIHPETAAKIGVKTGDAVKVTTDFGSVETIAYLYSGIRRDAIAIPLGQGHTSYGRYAKGRGVNPLALLPPAQNAGSGAVAYLSVKAKAEKSIAKLSFATTQHQKDQHDRGFAQVIPVAALLGAAANGHGEAAAGAHEASGHEAHAALPSQSRPGKYTEPLAQPEGYVPPAHSVSPVVPEHIVRGPRRMPVDQGSYDARHALHRWGMAIDLNSCTGCSACVVACHAENNIPMVGPELVKRGREMHWLRIDRWEEKVDGGANDVRFSPMLCQHCSDAPCEVVCPVYATYHNPEGLNAQIYNRCVGTRYCSNNCPYKVRAFNFFDYSAPEKDTFAFPEPLNWQLNPDVTVRSKGVMEKCTFCVQRVLETKGNARDEGRPIRDGELQTACQQTCPTQAIVFGDLLDPNSAVSKASSDGRKYWVLEELNTKPAITYRKKVSRDTGAGA